MPVLADAHDARDRPVGFEQGGIALHFGRDVHRVARDPVERARTNQIDQPFVHDVAEAGRMLLGEAQIFVHVEDRDAVPRDIIPGLQLLIERQLGIAGGEDRRRRALLGDRLTQDRSQIVRRGRREPLEGVEDAHA